MKTKFQSFLEAKNISSEDFNAKSAEEMAGLYNEYNEKAQNELTEAIEAKASKEDIDTLKAELTNNQAEQVKALNATLKEYGVAIKKLSTEEKSAKEGEHVSIFKALSSQKEGLTSVKEGSNQKVIVKAAGDMLISTNVSGGNVPVEQRLAGMNPIASRMVRLLDIVSRGTAESNVISWVYQANKDGAAGGTAEGALKNQIDFDLVVASESVKKRTAYIKVSDEMVDDISFMTSEINNELLRELLKDVESQVYEGDGTGNNLRGIRTVATAFAAGSFAASVDNANIVDVLRVAMNQVKIADQVMPNYILMNPSDVTALKLVKVGSTDDRYIDQLQMVGSTLMLDGVSIIESTLVAQDDYLVGAFDLATVYDKGSISIEVGLDSDDFTKNLRTVRAEWRGLVIVKNNDRTAFVAGDFTTDKLAIETP
jgi:HK97 family phage major capsid protein